MLVIDFVYEGLEYGYGTKAGRFKKDEGEVRGVENL